MERIEELLEEAYSTDDPGEMERLSREVLGLDENNVEALILLADTIEYSQEKITILEKARSALADDVEIYARLGECSSMRTRECVYCGNAALASLFFPRERTRKPCHCTGD
jgi:hypothetical protein